jgi:hypothetical protein
MAQSVQLGDSNLTNCILFEFVFENQIFEFEIELVEIGIIWSNLNPSITKLFNSMKYSMRYERR